MLIELLGIILVGLTWFIAGKKAACNVKNGLSDLVNSSTNLDCKKEK